MKFRTQMLLAFVPIFLLLGVSGETVLTLLERGEARWGLEEEASTLALALAEFLHDRPFTAPAATGRTWEDSLGLVMHRGQVRRLFIFNPDGRTVRWQAGPIVEGAAPLVSDADRARLQSDLWVDTGPVSRGSEAVFASCAVLRAADNGIAGYVLVEIGAEDYLRLIAQGPRTIAVGAGLSLLAGLLAMGVIVVPVVRSLRELRESANRALAGESLTPSGNHRIQELGDLGQTFGTVGTLLNEALEKTKRTLIENEQLRTPADLAAAFYGRFIPPLQQAFGPATVAARLLGADPGGAFFGCHAGDERICAFLGAVEAPDELQRAIQASAARTFLLDALGRLTVPAAFAAAGNYFTFTSWQCVAWLRRDGIPACWSMPAGGSGVVHTDIAPGTPLCLHTPGAAAEATIDACLANFKTLPAADLLANLGCLAGLGTWGALLVLQPSASSSHRPVP